MFGTGLLVLTSPVSRLRQSLPQLLTAASQKVADTLYIHVAPDIQHHQQPVSCTTEVLDTVTSLYSNSAELCSKLDIRVLLHNLTCGHSSKQANVFPHLHKPCDIILTDYSKGNSEKFVDFIQHVFPKTDLPLEYIPSEIEDGSSDLSDVIKGYDNVVIGGTFDRLHNGHKILLAESQLRSNKLLAIGVTAGAMNSKKTLCELITPCDQRISELREFLTDVKPSLDYMVEPITDGYGMSITIPELECIVVSEETVKGGNMVNDRRREKGFKELDLFVIKLAEDKHHSLEEEEKISSSSYRKRMLGTLTCERMNKATRSTSKDGCNKPYLIGLTGGIASGKSSICKRMERLGASIIDCDKLGHKAYIKGTEAFENIVATFGKDIVDSTTGEVDRKKLGAIVFSSKEKMSLLNNIVWPAIAKLVNMEVDKLSQGGASVVVLDAAVLLEAGWDSFVNEVWCSVIPKQQAVIRIKERNNLSEEDALKRIESQLSNQTRVDQSNVVLSTLWETSVTQKQVEKAWSLLKERIRAQAETSSKI